MKLRRRRTTIATVGVLLIVITIVSYYFVNRSEAPRPSTGLTFPTSTVSAGTSICELLTGSELKTIAGQLPNGFYGYHHSSGDIPKLSCTIRFYKSLPDIELSYEPRVASQVKIPGDEVPYFNRIASLEGASPITASNLQGRGVIFYDLRGSAALAWEYSDGNILSMRMLNHDGGTTQTDPQQRDQNVHILTMLTKQIGNRVPAVASGPDNTTSFP